VVCAYYNFMYGVVDTVIANRNSTNEVTPRSCTLLIKAFSIETIII
jgi:hypothetical protein